MMNGFVSSSEFSRSSKLSDQRIRQLLAAGNIAGAFRVGGRWVIPSDASITRVPAGRPVRTRAKILKLAAKACEAALEKAGVRALVVGSLAYGGVRPESDLDLLIVASAGRKWSEIHALALDAARPFDISVDVIFADTLPAAVKAVMLKDAKRAGVL